MGETVTVCLDFSVGNELFNSPFYLCTWKIYLPSSSAPASPSMIC